jgi:hypothetical protein
MGLLKSSTGEVKNDLLILKIETCKNNIIEMKIHLSGWYHGFVIGKKSNDS